MADDTMSKALSVAEMASADMTEQGCDRLSIAVALTIEARTQAFKACQSPEAYAGVVAVLVRTLKGEKEPPK